MSKVLVLMSLPESLANYYHEEIDRCRRDVQILPLSREHLRMAKEGAEVVVVIVHHDTEHDALALAGGELLPTKELIDSLNGFHGTVDLSSCFTDGVFSELKTRYADNIHVIASPGKVDLGRTLFVLPFIIRKYAACGDYREAFFAIQTMFSQLSADQPELVQHTDNGALGTSAAAYNPLTLRREEPAVIPFVIWDDGAVSIEDVEEVADAIYPDVKKKVIQKLPNLQIGDEITVEISFPGNASDLIKVDNPVAVCQWEGGKTSIGFRVCVSKTYKQGTVCPKFDVKYGGKQIDIHFTINIETVQEEKGANSQINIIKGHPAESTGYPKRENIDKKELAKQQLQSIEWITPNVRRVFEKAIEYGWMEASEKGFKWIGFGTKNKNGDCKSRTRKLAYLCDMAFALDERKVPWPEIEHLFGEENKQLGRDLYNALGTKSDLHWKQVIGDIIKKE